jgi:hypothetical protein
MSSYQSIKAVAKESVCTLIRRELSVRSDCWLLRKGSYFKYISKFNVRIDMGCLAKMSWITWRTHVRTIRITRYSTQYLQILTLALDGFARTGLCYDVRI